MSNNTESNIPVKFTENSNNEWINWIEEAIAKDYFKYYELNQFTKFQEIGVGGFGKVYRAKWKSSPNYLALKSFFNCNNVTIKEIVKELKIQREVDFHENIIRFCGIATENQVDNSKKYWLVMEYANGESKPNEVCLAINISQGLRETPIPDTPEDYVNIYADCWNNEPDNRPTINQIL
ncbi:unnamed protein product [Rhizophagus irregularis]|uniref:Protein kinase domain-containing protein n=1 Tax=Rhizophagus irregularis TaxID=588596 RepID=A0A916EJB3_9GLOM|nr:unnamed protein product [Rhizophagus irregularis]